MIWHARAGLLTLLAQPLRAMRHDIHAQRGLLAAQLTTTRSQLDALRARVGDDPAAWLPIFLGREAP